MAQLTLPALHPPGTRHKRASILFFNCAPETLRFQISDLMINGHEAPAFYPAFGPSPFVTSLSTHAARNPFLSRITLPASPSPLPAMVYIRTYELEGHRARITSLALSPNGEWLASGDDAGNISVWSTQTGAEVASLKPDCNIDRAVIALMWMCGFQDHSKRIVAGCSGGTLVWFDDFEDAPNRIETGLLDERGDVHCLTPSSDGCSFAIGIGASVKVLSSDGSGYTVVKTLPQPSRDGFFHLDDSRVRARGLHFTPQGARLIVSYLNHGIVEWDLQHSLSPPRVLIPIHFPGHIGNSAISSDGRTIAVFNLRDGVDLYRTDTLGHQTSFPVTGISSENNIPLNIAFDNEASTLVSGGHQGRLCVWDIGTKAVRYLPCGGAGTVSVLGVGSSGRYDLIVASSRNGPPKVFLWQQDRGLLGVVSGWACVQYRNARFLVSRRAATVSYRAVFLFLAVLVAILALLLSGISWQQSVGVVRSWKTACTEQVSHTAVAVKSLGRGGYQRAIGYIRRQLVEFIQEDPHYGKPKEAELFRNLMTIGRRSLNLSVDSRTWLSLTGELKPVCKADADDIQASDTADGIVEDGDFAGLLVGQGNTLLEARAHAS
ncbi:WD40-repeat-containing domain protein [Coprinopsis sp. MPI-PUGE-AT-0042]|nr:WD40-repeat-containing domain protein [Coprinopsis sp. MPI-PUGE-AT-0042]